VSENGVDGPSLGAVQRLVREGAFEEVLVALEEVVAHLERGRLSLDESVAWYEAGLGLSRRCTELLEQAELRISRLEERYALPDGGRWDGDDEGMETELG
jgi:exodeoxyribonuclease VII small subunit